MNDTKLNYQQLNEMFEAYLEERAFDGFPNVLQEPASHIMNIKGKRIRPMLLMTACQAFNGDLEVALGPASAIEIYHNFSLVHDDIIDVADIRRGEPTVHKVFGTDKAILAGDAMLIHATKLLSKVPNDKLPAMLDVFLKATARVIEGEQYDVDFEEMTDVSEDLYMMMIEYKTSVLLAAALQLGAILGGASVADQKHIYNFGLYLGLSFQIKDDYLDTYGDVKTFGKRIGGDILQDKKTFLLIKALENCGDNERIALFDLFAEKDEEAKINGMTALYNELGVKEKTFARMEELYQQSLDSLKQLSVDDSSKQSLFNLAEMVYHRKH